jgi:outer membrane protein assembly factor BamB
MKPIAIMFSLLVIVCVYFNAVSIAAEKKNEPAKDDQHWPSFRGPFAGGSADSQNLPLKWNGTNGQAIKFKVKIPGLAHSSPVIWGNRLFLTTAVSSKDDASFKPGLYGSGEASSDQSSHLWQVICIDKRNGKTLWKQTATKGKPIDKRHIKATYANATPATDGEHIVALFGSQGLFAYTVEGEFLWKKELGRLNVGAYDLPEYEWGSASSPILFNDMVIVQCDTQKDSFLIAIDVTTGKTIWKTKRDELPSWGTPTIYQGKQQAEIITNGSKFIRGYDPKTGKELWRLGGSSKITAPTPVFADGMIIVASGRSPERPIFAIRAGASGNISLKHGEKANKHIAWSKVRRGPYMPTPLIYKGLVYTLNNNGLLGCYDLKIGTEHYYQRIPHRALGFSASPIAADGRIYLPGEDGVVFVIQAGLQFKLLAMNPVGEPIMATPAVSEGVLYIRGSHHLFAVKSKVE